MLSLADGEEVSSMRPEAEALGLLQPALKAGTMDDVSKRLRISKNPVYTCLDILEKRNGIFIQESFLCVCFKFKSFCSVLFKSNNQTHSSLWRNCISVIMPL